MKGHSSNSHDSNNLGYQGKGVANTLYGVQGKFLEMPDLLVRMASNCM